MSPIITRQPLFSQNPTSASIHPDLAERHGHIDGGPSFFVKTLYPFKGNPPELTLVKGEIIEVLTQLPSGWWDGFVERTNQRGWFPSNYVKKISDEEAYWAGMKYCRVQPTGQTSADQTYFRQS